MKEKLIVGIDGSEQSYDALRFAIYYAKAIGLEEIEAVFAHSEKEELEAKEALDKADSIGEEKNIRVDTGRWVVDKDPATDIVNYAESRDFTHIIVGHRGKTSIERILLGSVAESIVERAHCKTTVVRGECPSGE